MASTKNARSKGVVGALDNFSKEGNPRQPTLQQIDEGDSDEEQKKRNLPKPVNPVLKVLTFNMVPDWCHDVTNDSFNMFVGLIISMNALIIGMETDLGEEHFQFFEHFFCIFFLCEMAMRQYQLGCRGYFCDGSNVFDFSLVVSGTFDLYVMSYLVKGKKGGAVSTLRLLRMLRVMRILRLFKVFHELSIILAAFLKAFSAVMWVSVLTLIFDYVFAVFLTQTVGHKAEWWGEDRAKIETWFGSIGHSMRTLFIIMTLAEWDEIALELQKQIHGLIVFFFMIFYIMVAAFTMVSLITGIISEALIRAQSEDKQHKMDEIESAKEDFKKDVKALLMQLPGADDGYLSPNQIDEGIEEKGSLGKKMFSKLSSLEIEIDKKELMELVGKVEAFGLEQMEASASPRPEQDTREGVKIDDFVEALATLKGDAKASGVWELKHSLAELGHHQDTMHTTLRDLADKVKLLR